MTEAVAWEVPASGNVVGDTNCGGGRTLELEAEVGTVSNQIKISNLSETRSHVHDREAESCFSLSMARAWSSIKILLNDVTAKFVWVSLSEELLGEDSSSIGVISGFDEGTGEPD